MNYVQKLKKMDLSPEWYLFHLENSLHLLRETLPHYEAAGNALQTFWLEMIAHRERNQFGSRAVKAAELHDLEEDRRCTRREFKNIIESVRSDIAAIEHELEFLSRKTQLEQDQRLPGIVSGGVDNSPAENGQKSV